jgi:hypothetical protein
MGNDHRRPLADPGKSALFFDDDRTPQRQFHAARQGRKEGRDKWERSRTAQRKWEPDPGRHSTSTPMYVARYPAWRQGDDKLTSILTIINCMYTKDEELVREQAGDCAVPGLKPVHMEKSSCSDGPSAAPWP